MIARLARRLIGYAARLVPRGHRQRWEREWEAELWHRERALGTERSLLGPALGACVHAVWLRVQNPGFDSTLRDIAFAARSYRRSPSFSAAAVLTLGLGIAANVVVLAVIEGALLKPYAYGAADRLGVLVGRDADRPGVDLPLSFPDIAALRESGVFESVLAADWDPFNLRLDDRTEWIGAGLVSISMFETLGIEPIRGRGFAAGEDQPGAARVVVLGERIWRDVFGAREMVGEAIRLDGESYEVIGVAPAATDVPDGAEVWIPLAPTGERLGRGSNWLQAFVRLPPDGGWPEARVALGVLGDRIAATYPDTNEGRGFETRSLREERTAGLRPAFLALLAAVGLLLLIVCANLAGLLLARSANRRHEFGVRQALGASRNRLVRQLLTESLVLSVSGGVLGLLFGGWALRGLARLVSEQPVWFSPAIDLRIVGVTLGLTLLCGLIFGLAPVLAGAAKGLQASVRTGRIGPAQSRDILVFAEIALSTVLLVASGLLIRSLSEITAVDPGFDGTGRIAGTVQLPAARYEDDETVIGFGVRMIEALEARPAIAGAAIVTRMPFRSGTNSVMWWEDGQSEEAFRRNPQAELNSITPGYFSTMGIELRRGRGIDTGDVHDSEDVAVISETFAREFFGTRDPLGARISFSRRPRFARIVGVVEDTKHRGLDQASRFQIYVSFAQRPTNRLSVVAHAAAETGAAGREIRRIVRELDPDLAVSGLTPVEDAIATSVWRLRLLTRVFWVFGGFALLLASLGIAGIVAQAVARRTQEIGVRLALGAHSGHIMGLVGRRIGWIMLAGLAAGGLGALALGRFAEGTLYGVNPRDPLTFAVVIGGFLFVGVAAAWLPARHATMIDPLEALRAD